MDALERDLPLIGQLEATPQDPVWHAEGNVRIHTLRVVDEIYKVMDQAPVTKEERIALVLSAALHDIGKTLTTREKEIDGRVRIVSPRHAIRGRSYAALRLGCLDPWTREKVLGCIGYHHHPKQLVLKDAAESEYRRLARCADLRLLYLLEIADLRGRDCSSDLSGQLEELELFRLRAEELNLWNTTDPYADWRRAILKALPSQSERVTQYVVQQAIRDFETGMIFTPEEALARTYEHRENFSEVVVTCGLSGSGKSTWVDQNLKHHRIISLDAIRSELTGKVDDQSKNGEVMQLAKERLRESLRKNEDVVWESTGLRRDGRAVVIDLAHAYHASTRIVAFGTSPEVSKLQNRQRKNAIPSSVLERQLERLEWPEMTEADRVDSICVDSFSRSQR